MVISVIIPVYQAELFIKKAVESACEQEEVLEVIMVEDGSTDNTLRICESLVHEDENLAVRLFRHRDGQNRGISASRNLGIKMAIGKYIAFLDADDYYLPGRFKQDLEVLQCDGGIDGIYNALGVNIYDESERGRIYSNLTTVKYPIHHSNLFEEMVPIGNSGYFHGDTITVRRSIFSKVGLFDESLEVTEDTHMWLKMAAKASLVAGSIEHPVAIRGVHECNSVKNRNKVKHYRLLMYSSLLKWATENDVSVQRKRLLWKILYIAYVNSLTRRRFNRIGTKIRILAFLIKHGFSKPYLLGYKFYLSTFWHDLL